MNEVKNQGSPYASLILIFLIILAGGSYFCFFNGKNDDTINNDKDDLNTGNLNITVINGYTHKESNEKITIDIVKPKVDTKYTEINAAINQVYMFKVNNDSDLVKVREALNADYNKQNSPMTYSTKYEIYKNNNVVTIEIKDIYAINDSDYGVFNYYYVNFNSTNGKIVYLNDYLQSINKNLAQVNEIYKSKVMELNGQGDAVGGEYICNYKPLTNTSTFKVIEGKLYVDGNSCKYDSGIDFDESILID